MDLWKDERNRRTVIDMIPGTMQKGMHPIGRLDKESRGAILLTNDGDLALKLTHPRFNHSKHYSAWVKGIPTKSTLSKWREV